MCLNRLVASSIGASGPKGSLGEPAVPLRACKTERVDLLVADEAYPLPA